jgi:D-galactose 1-dehydrogenase
LNKDRYKLAIIGIGKIVRAQHLKAIYETDNFEIVATQSGHGGLENIPNFTSLDELFANCKDIEAVIIATPPQNRAQIVLECMKHGVHIFMEKPPSSTLGAFQEILEYAPEYNATLYTTWHLRFGYKVQEAAEWVKQRKITKCDIIWRESARKWHPNQQWLWDAGGMGVFDPGMNAFSIITKILGKRIIVDNAEFEIPSNQCAPIAVNMDMHYHDIPIKVNLDFREENNEIWEIRIEDDKGDFIILSHGGARLSYNGADAEIMPDVEYVGLYNDFARLIKEGKHDIDLSPQIIVSDAFCLASIKITDEYQP